MGRRKLFFCVFPLVMYCVETLVRCDMFSLVDSVPLQMSMSARKSCTPVRSAVRTLPVVSVAPVQRDTSCHLTTSIAKVNWNLVSPSPVRVSHQGRLVNLIWGPNCERCCPAVGTGKFVSVTSIVSKVTDRLQKWFVLLIGSTNVYHLFNILGELSPEIFQNFVRRCVFYSVSEVYTFWIEAWYDGVMFFQKHGDFVTLNVYLGLSRGSIKMDVLPFTSLLQSPFP